MVQRDTIPCHIAPFPVTIARAHAFLAHSNSFLDIQGVKMAQTEWAKKKGISDHPIWQRGNSGKTYLWASYHIWLVPKGLNFQVFWDMHSAKMVQIGPETSSEHMFGHSSLSKITYGNFEFRLNLDRFRSHFQGRAKCNHWAIIGDV